MKAFYVFVLLIIISINCTQAQEDPPAARNFKLIHFDADISVNPVNQAVKGKADFTISPLSDKTDSLVFVTSGMKISSVSSSNTATKFRQDKDILIIYPQPLLQKGKLSHVEISYSAINVRELHFTGWNDTTGRMRKQVWAHRPIGWIPYTDQMTTQDIRITFDKNYKVVSNGERVKTTPSGDTAITWHYRLDKPHPFYSICLVAGDYKFKSSITKGGIPLELWYYPDLEERFANTYLYQAEMFDFFEREIGVKYPYGLYRNLPVADYLYGAMETTTSTVYGDFMQVDKRGFFGRNFVNTNAHELAHQWFGNCINDKTVKDLWLTESFATYFAKIFERSVYGDNQYEFVRDVEFQKAFKIAELNNNPLGSGRAGTERWYQKGSLVMDMMRDVLGDENFKASIKAYMEMEAYSEAESNDFLKAIYETTGQPLDWFFQEWIYKGGEPVYKVSWKDLRDKDKRFTQLFIEQVQKLSDQVGLFKMPVNIEVHYNDGSLFSKIIWIEKQSELFSIPNSNGKDVAYVVFDAGSRILKHLQFDRSFEELSAQALSGSTIADRLEALKAMRLLPLSTKRECLSQCYSKEKFHLTRSEIILQLASDSLSYPIIKQAINDPNALVRKAVLDNIVKIPEVLQQEYTKLLEDSAYFNVESALINLTNSAFSSSAFSGNDKSAVVNAYLDVTRNEIGWRGRNIRISWLGIAIRQYPGKPEYLKELIDYCSPSFEFETRINAFNQLKKLNYLDELSCRYLVNASVYWNTKLSPVAKELISYFSQQEKYLLLFLYHSNW